jgi:hypothetical protein
VITMRRALSLTALLVGLLAIWCYVESERDKAIYNFCFAIWLELMAHRFPAEDCR